MATTRSGANNHYRGDPKAGRMLSEETKQWSTPRAEDSESSGMRHARGVADTLTAQTNLWATPNTARRGTETPEKKALRQSENRGGCSDLLTQAEYWQTPAAENFRSRGGDRIDEMGLDRQAKYWPTPDAQLMNDGTTPEAWNRFVEREKEKGYNGNGHGMPLGMASRMWPTPMAADDGDKVSPASHQGGLCVVTREWPSPASRDYRSPNLKPYAERGGGVKGEQLPNFVAHFSPQGPEIPPGSTSSTPVESLDGATLSPTKKADSVLGRRRLNPAFVCWLMGWPWWWTRAEPTSFGAAEMVLWRSRVQLHLCFLLGGR